MPLPPVTAATHPLRHLQQLKRQMRRLDEMSPAAARDALRRDIQWAKSQLRRRPTRSGTANAAGRQSQRSPRRTTAALPAPRRHRPAAASPPAAKSSQPGTGLSKLLNPKNLQDSLKAVNNLRTTVKHWLGYLQQADQLLDTLHSTTQQLRETGVLEKLVKHRGKNLTTEDYTNLLVALMNSPLGSQFMKSLHGSHPDQPPAEGSTSPAAGRR
ncbi:MAG: hypothetical protein K6T26_01270 [Alicyclobacillus sp.]|nr:hypothetical protein [Alicyclobacillus sp.]